MHPAFPLNVLQSSSSLPYLVLEHVPKICRIRSIQATYRFNDKWQIKAGPYLSYVRTRTFKGAAYDGYLRVGDPTGEKVELGTTDGNRGTYDFSDSMRKLQWGMMVGADWHFHHSWGIFVDLSWGFTGIFKGNFDTIEQTMYPVYGTVGVSYRMK